MNPILTILLPCLLLLGSPSLSSAQSAESALSLKMKAPGSLPVMRSPSETAETVIFTAPNQTLIILDERGEYTKVKLLHNGKAETGYIWTADLYGEKSAERPGKSRSPAANGVDSVRERKYGSWAFGLGADLTRFSQAGRSFTNPEDQVIYTLSRYVSQTTAPFLALQWRRRDFWRLRLAYRTFQFSGTAVSNVAGAPDHSVSVQYAGPSASLERAFNLSSWFYLGLNAEVIKATNLSVQFDQQNLDTAGLTPPTYLGASGGVGVLFPLGQRGSLGMEAHLGGYLSQATTTIAYGLEIISLFWF